MGQLTNDFRSGVTQIFDYASENVTVSTVSYTYDSNDDPTESASTTTVSCVIQFVNLEDQEEYGGELKVGDAIAFFKYTTTVVLGDRITHNSIDYRVKRIFADPVEGNQVFHQCWLKRIE